MVIFQKAKEMVTADRSRSPPAACACRPRRRSYLSFEVWWRTVCWMYLWRSWTASALAEPRLEVASTLNLSTADLDKESRLDRNFMGLESYRCFGGQPAVSSAWLTHWAWCFQLCFQYCYIYHRYCRIGPNHRQARLTICFTKASPSSKTWTAISCFC